MTLPLAAVLLTLGAADVPPNSLRFVANSTAVDVAAGRVNSLAADGTVTLAEPDATVAAGQLISLRQLDRALPAPPSGAQFILANGDRFPGIPIGGDGRSVRVRTGLAAEPWPVPLSNLAAIWITPPPADLPTDPMRYPWRESVRRNDVVLFRNSDTITGTVEGVSDDGKSLRFSPGRGQPVQLLAFTQIAAVAFDPTLARVRPPKGFYYRVTTSDGSRIGLSRATIDGNTLSGTTLFGQKLERPLTSVLALDVLQGKSVYLSDVKPIRATVEPFNTVNWPWQADRSVKGNPLRLAGPHGDEWFDKGLGTHPKTVLTYSLAGKYRRFEASVGLDSVTGRRGSAVVQVLVDGVAIPVDGLGTLTAANSPVAVRVPVIGAKELTLIVDFGPSGDVQADVNWGNARLVE